jgi:hypothetical protein
MATAATLSVLMRMEIGQEKFTKKRQKTVDRNLFG